MVVAASDFTVQQHWTTYTAEQHAVWRALYERQIAQLRTHAVSEVLQGLERLGAVADAIPRFEAVNERLAAATGWRIVAVPGLIPDEAFYALLAARRFPVTVWMRSRAQLDYLVEPDLFHDFFGHVPLLTLPVFARFMQAYGAAGPKAIAHQAVALLARLYWYTVEFGLIRTESGLKAYGAGILSSHTETEYSLASREPRRLPFELARVMRTAYRIDTLQRTYFVIDSFEQLFGAAYDTDFAPLYRRLQAMPAIAPGELLDGERVIPPLVGNLG